MAAGHTGRRDRPDRAAVAPPPALGPGAVSQRGFRRSGENFPPQGRLLSRSWRFYDFEYKYSGVLAVGGDGVMIRIALRSDRRLFADLLAADLAARPEYAIVGAVADVADLRQLCALREPDLAVVHLDGGLGPDPDQTLEHLRACLGVVRLVVLHDRLGATELCALGGLGVDALVS